MKRNNEVLRVVSTTKIKGVLLPMILLLGIGFLTGSVTSELGMIKKQEENDER